MNHGSRTRKYLIRAAILLLVLGAGYVTYSVFTSNWFLKPRVEQALSRHLDIDCQLKNIEFGILSGTRIEQITLNFDHGQSKESASSLVLQDCFVTHRFWTLIGGEYAPKRIHLGRMEATIGKNFVEWIEGDPFKKEKTPSSRPPHITLQDGVLHFPNPLLAEPLTLRDLQASLVEDRHGLLSAVVTFRMGENLVTAQLNSVAGQKQKNLKVAAQEFDISDIPEIPPHAGVKHLSDLSFAGILDGHIRTALGPNQNLPLAGQFTLSDVKVNYADWPVGLTALSGEIQFNDRQISVVDLNTSVGGGRLTIPSGQFRFDEDGIASISAQGSFYDLNVATLTRSAFPWSDHLRGEWGSLENGSMNGNFRVHWSPDSKPTYEADIELREGTARVSRIERDLTGLKGDVKIDGHGKVEFSSVQGTIADGRVRASGALQIEKGNLKKPFIDISFSGLPLTPKLVKNTPPAVRNVLQDIRLEEARAGGDFTIEPEELSCNLDIQAATVDPKAVEYKLTEFSSDVSWSSSRGRISFTDLQANRKNGRIGGNFAIDTKDTVTMDAELFGRAIPIDDGLLALFPAKIREKTQKWTPAGSFDVELRCNNWEVPQELSPDTLEGLNISLNLRDIRLSQGKKPPLLTGLHGNVSLKSTTMRMIDLTGQLSGQNFRMSGILPLGGQNKQTTNIQLEADALSLSPEWFSALPADFTKKIAELNPRGHCSVNLNITQLPRGEHPLKASATGVLHNLELNPHGTPIRMGGTSGLELTVAADKQLETSGNIRLRELDVANLVADRVTGDFSYDGKGLKIPSLAIGAYGGKIQLNDLQLSPDLESWRLGLQYSHIDLETLMGAFGIEGRKAPGGVLRGRLDLEGEGLNPEKLRGKGHVRIDRGRLYNIPVLLSVFSVLDLTIPRHSPVSDAYGTFRVGDGRLTIKDLLLSGGDIPVHLEGHVAMEKNTKLPDQPLKLLVTVPASPNVLDSVPVVGWIKKHTIDRLRHLILQARVKGTFSDYTVSTVTDPITRPIKAIWSLMPKLAPDIPEEEGNTPSAP